MRRSRKEKVPDDRSPHRRLSAGVSPASTHAGGAPGIGGAVRSGAVPTPAKRRQPPRPLSRCGFAMVCLSLAGALTSTVVLAGPVEVEGQAPDARGADPSQLSLD